MFSRLYVTSLITATLASALFTTACARRAHIATPNRTATQQPVAQKPAAQAPASQAPVAAPKTADVPAQATGKAPKYFAVVETEGDNKGKCTAGVVATFNWHQRNDAALQGQMQSALDALNVARKSGQGVAEAGAEVRRVSDNVMPTLLSMSKNYPPNFVCEVAGSGGKIIGAAQLGADQIKSMAATIKNDPAVPARLR